MAGYDKKQHVGKVALLMALSVGFALFVSCGGKKSSGSESPEGKIVVQLGDSVLYEGDVYSRIPAGITSADSAMLYDAIVQSWLEKRLLVDVAALNLPTVERIDRMVEDYRMQLIANEYRRVMAESDVGAADERETRRYYDEHKEELRLQWPLVKGVYVKASADSPRISEICRWIASGDSRDIERLETYGLEGAIQYDNFRDTWVSWKSLEEVIPYRFEESADTLSEGYCFDRAIGNSIYLLKILEVMPEGDVMPYEFAKKEINRVMADRRRSSYDTNLLRRLYADAAASHKLKPGGYVPMKFRTDDSLKKGKK